MKQIRKTTLKNNAFVPFAQFAADSRASISDPEALSSFTDSVKKELQIATSTENFIYGHRTESMFGEMVVSFGSVRLIKAEDGVDTFAAVDGLQVPDYRIVTEGGEQLLVEVKNFNQKDAPAKEFSMKKDYLDGLQAYANLTRSQLFIAIYWARWRLWSLVSPSAFHVSGELAHVGLGEAMMNNRMSVLGDSHIGTLTPLQMVLRTEQLSGRITKSGSEHTVRITGLDLYCSGSIIHDPVERRIAFYLMMWGKWEMSKKIRRRADKVTRFAFEFRPDQQIKGQDFHLVGPLSSMFASFYLCKTSAKDSLAVAQIYARSEPGALGRLIPPNYKGKALPLWILRQQV